MTTNNNSRLITNALIVNEGEIKEGDVRISDGRIAAIGGSLPAQQGEAVLDANGAWLLPGMIDDQVHFREPGLTAKGDMATESAAAVAGGITTNPQTYDTLLGGFYTVWLQASPHEHMQRVLDQGDRRPVSGVTGAMDALQEILRNRESEYARAQFSLDTSGKSVAQSTEELADIVRPLAGNNS